MKTTVPILLLLAVGTLHAQREWSFVNVGFKFSHTFGPDGGFTPGVEVSYTFFGERLGGGLLLSADVCKRRSKVHIGIEGMAAAAGVSMGPTWISDGENTAIGYTLTVFAGFLIYPYYSFTSAPDAAGYHELGSFLKFPIQASGRRFSLGG